MGLLRWMERTTERINAFSDENQRAMEERAGRLHPFTTPRPRAVAPDPERGVQRTLTEDDVNGFLAASGQAPEAPARVDADTFMASVRHGKDKHRLRRLERDLSWLRTEATRAGVPASQLGDVP